MVYDFNVEGGGTPKSVKDWKWQEQKSPFNDAITHGQIRVFGSKQSPGEHIAVQPPTADAMRQALVDDITKDHPNWTAQQVQDEVARLCNNK